MRLDLQLGNIFIYFRGRKQKVQAGKPSEQLFPNRRSVSYPTPKHKTNGTATEVSTGVIQLIPPVLSSEALLHILLSSEYSGFRPSTTAVVTQPVHT